MLGHKVRGVGPAEDALYLAAPEHYLALPEAWPKFVFTIEC